MVAYLKEMNFTLALAPSIRDIDLPPAHRALIDMPIGLPESIRRSCDAQARTILGPRRSTLFPVPTRRAVYARSYHEACDVNAELQNMRLSKQLWNITPKMRDVDMLLRLTPTLHNSLAEGHPELAFLALSTTNTPLPPKKTDEGRSTRISILRRYLTPSFEHTVQQFMIDNRSAVTMPDILDAIALATLLHRSLGEAYFLGNGEIDAHQNPCRICYR